MKLSQRMHDKIWGTYTNPIVRENEEHEWLNEVCKLEAQLAKTWEFVEMVASIDYEKVNTQSIIVSLKSKALHLLKRVKEGRTDG